MEAVRLAHRTRVSNIATCVMAACVALAACDREREAPAPAATTITVSAAASLREALTETERRYEAANPGVDVRTNFGASGALQHQIERGAPVDVFASAAERPMDVLQQRGLVDARSRRTLAGNDLVLIVPASTDAATVSGFEELASARVRRVAMGAPASVPAGEYADEVLRTLGIREAVHRKAVLGQDVRAVLAYVASGEADAGIVYRTDAASAADRVRIVAQAPAGSHPPITYPIAITTAARDPVAARGYVGYLLGPEGQQVLRTRGFRVEP